VIRTTWRLKQFGHLLDTITATNNWFGTVHENSKLEFLFAVSHCSDITKTVSKKKFDTEEHSWNESVKKDSSNNANPHSSDAYTTSASSFSLDNVRDIC